MRFNTVVAMLKHIEQALLSQGCRSSDGYTCRYRLVEGDRILKCAAGHLIEDAHYNSSLEENTLSLDVVQKALIDSGITEAQLPWVHLAQRIHDSVDPVDWCGAFKALRILAGCDSKYSGVTKFSRPFVSVTYGE
jgi:hypothetical protein